MNIEEIVQAHYEKLSEIEREYKTNNVEILQDNQLYRQRVAYTDFQKRVGSSALPKKYKISTAQRVRSGKSEFMVLQMTIKQEDRDGNPEHHYDKFGELEKPTFRKNYVGDERILMFSVDEVEPYYFINFSREQWDEVKDYASDNIQFLTRRGGKAYVIDTVDPEEDWLGKPFAELEHESRRGKTKVADGEVQDNVAGIQQ